MLGKDSVCQWCVCMYLCVCVCVCVCACVCVCVCLHTLKANEITLLPHIRVHLPKNPAYQKLFTICCVCECVCMSLCVCVCVCVCTCAKGHGGPLSYGSTFR